MANVWFKSRTPGAAGRVTTTWVQPVGNSYADVIRNGRRFRFSYETITLDETGTAIPWLVFEDTGAV